MYVTSVYISTYERTRYVNCARCQVVCCGSMVLVRIRSQTLEKKWLLGGCTSYMKLTNFTPVYMCMEGFDV